MADNENKEFTSAGVNFHCDLKIKDRQIISENIVHLCIREWIFDIIPRIEIILNDDGTLTELFPIQDGDLISIELKKNINDTEPIISEFLVMGYTAGAMHGNKYTQMIIVGALNVKDFYSPVQSRSFKNKSSVDVLKQILFAEGGVSLLSTLTPTVDVMTWLQIQNSNLDFCKHILKRAYLPNDTMFLFANASGEFTYTSFKTEEAKEIEGTARRDLDKYCADGFEDNADYKEYWFNTYNIYDMNPLMNIKRNYGASYTYFDTLTGKKNTKLNDTTHPLTPDGFSSKDKEKKDSISHDFSLGYLPVGNVHPKYYDGIIQNEYLRHNFMSGFLLELNINSISKPRLMGKINVILPSLFAPGANEPLSGEYMVAGIIHDIGRGDVYKKRVQLMRNGYEKSQFVKTPTLAE